MSHVKGNCLLWRPTPPRRVINLRGRSTSEMNRLDNILGCGSRQCSPGVRRRYAKSPIRRRMSNQVERLLSWYPFDVISLKLQGSKKSTHFSCSFDETNLNENPIQSDSKHDITRKSHAHCEWRQAKQVQTFCLPQKWSSQKVTVKFRNSGSEQMKTKSSSPLCNTSHHT